MKYLKLYEEYSKIFESVESDLVDELDDNFIEEYFDEHLANDDFDEIINLWPSIIWNHIDDKRAMRDIIYDEKQFRELEDFDYDIKDYINGKHITDDEYDEIFDKHIKSKVDLEEREDLKRQLKETDDIEEKKDIRKDIRKINKEIKRIKELNLDELLDEMSNEDLRSVIEEVFDSDEFISHNIEKRYKNYSLQEYVEDTYGSVDSITFGGYNNKGDWDWILKYVDEDAVIKENQGNESFDYKRERVQEEIADSEILQTKILEKDPKNSIVLFDLFINNSWVNAHTIGNDYEFQKAYIEAYAEDYYEDDLDEGKSVALKSLNGNFDLDLTIQEEYSDYMHYIYADKYNI